jgi:hypothetical protein
LNNGISREQISEVVDEAPLELIGQFLVLFSSTHYRHETLLTNQISDKGFEEKSIKYLKRPLLLFNEHQSRVAQDSSQHILTAETDIAECEGIGEAAFISSIHNMLSASKFLNI